MCTAEHLVMRDSWNRASGDSLAGKGTYFPVVTKLATPRLPAVEVCRDDGTRPVSPKSERQGRETLDLILP
jgi:hypothetical protein